MEAPGPKFEANRKFETENPKHLASRTSLHSPSSVCVAICSRAVLLRGGPAEQTHAGDVALCAPALGLLAFTAFAVGNPTLGKECPPSSSLGENPVLCLERGFLCRHLPCAKTRRCRALRRTGALGRQINERRGGLCHVLGKMFWPLHLSVFYPYDRSRPVAVFALAACSSSSFLSWLSAGAGDSHTS